MKLGAAAALALVALVGATRDAKASPQARLVYGRGAGAESCPDEESLRHAVAARVGYDPFFPWAPRTVIVSIARHGERLVGRVEMVDDQARSEGAREIASSTADCAALFDTLALAISVAIDPQVLVAPAKPATPPAPAVTPPPPPPAPVPAPPPVEPPPAERAAVRPPSNAARLRLALGARGAIGSLPATSAGLTFLGALTWSRASIGLEAAIDLPASTAAPAGGSVSAWTAGGAVVPCAIFGALHACGVASFARFAASASDVPAAQSQAALRLAFGARAMLETPITPALAAFVDGDLLGDAARPTIRVGATDVWRAPPIDGAIGLGVAAYF